MPDGHLHGHVLQHDNRLGPLLSDSLISSGTALDQLPQQLEHERLPTSYATLAQHQRINTGTGIL